MSEPMKISKEGCIALVGAYAFLLILLDVVWPRKIEVSPSEWFFLSLHLAAGMVVVLLSLFLILKFSPQSSDPEKFFKSFFFFPMKIMVLYFLPLIAFIFFPIAFLLTLALSLSGNAQSGVDFFIITTLVIWAAIFPFVQVFVLVSAYYRPGILRSIMNSYGGWYVLALVIVQLWYMYVFHPN